MARENEKEALIRTELERRAGLEGDVTDNPDPIHHRYLDA